MVVHSCNDPVPHFSLWPKRSSLRIVLFPATALSIQFSEVAEAFLTQYASRQEAKRSSHHLFSVKMRQGENLKSYVNFFHGQLAKVPNYGEEV